MVTTAASVDWTVVANEVEALQLEYSWIKEFDPRFNVRYRDDKSYPYLAVTVAEEFPRVTVMRGAKRKGVRYFGPYAHAWAIRETVDQLLRVFPVRTCSSGVFRRAGQVGRPVPARLHRQVLAPRASAGSAPRSTGPSSRTSCAFMDGRTAPFVRRLRARDARRGRPSWTSSGRPGCATTSRRWSGPLEKQRGRARRRHRRRRDRAGRRPARGRRPGVPRPRRAGPRPAGLRRREGGGRPACRSSSRRCCSSSTARSPGTASPARCWSRRCRRTVPAAEEWLSGTAAARRGGPGPAARGQAVAAGDRRAQRRAVPRPAQGPSRRRPHHPSAGARGDPGGPRPRPGAAAHRVHRRVQPAGHRRGRVPGGVRGRAAPQVPSTAGSRSRASTARTTSGRSPRPSPGGSAATSTSGPRPSDPELAVGDGETPTSRSPPGRSTPTTGRPRRFAYPPQLLVIDGGPPQVPPRRGRPGRPRHRRRRGLRTRQAARGGVAPGPPGPGDPAAHAARVSTCCSGSGTRRTGSRWPTTAARRSARLTASALDDVPGARRGAAQGPAAPVRVDQAAAPGVRSTRSPRSPASARPPPPPS